MKTSKLIIALIIFSVAALPISASELKTEDHPKFDFDAVNTASDNFNLSHLDIYVRVNFDELQFLKSDDGFRASYEIIVSILDKSGHPIDVKDAREEILTEEVNDIQSIRKFKLNKFSFDLPPAKYEIVLSLQDLETQKVTNRKQDITLKKYPKSDFLASDILYLDYVSEDADGNLKFNPKVSGSKLPDSRLYAYFEVYNIPDSDSVFVSIEIVNPKNGKSLQQESHEYWLRSGGRVTKSYLEVADSRLPHGRYTTRIQVKHDNDTVSLERPFEWYWEGLPSSFSNLDEAIDALAYIVSKEELQKLQAVSMAEKHQAYLKFWEKHDPTPGTSENEFRMDYYERIAYANDNFFGHRKPGWKTDMGWAYVLLGPPDSIERNPFNQKFATLPGRTIKALEVWTYYRYSRQLIFIDELGFGEYRLDNPVTLYDMIK